MAKGATEGGLEPDDSLDEDRVGGSKTRFMVSLGKPQLAALREYAGRKGLSIAEVLRRAVDEFLDRRARGSTPANGSASENSERRVARGDDSL